MEAGGIIAIMAFVGSARKRSLFRLQVYERVEISLVKVYQRVGKCAIRLKDEFYSFIKSEIRDSQICVSSIIFEVANIRDQC